MVIWLWLAFILFILAMLALDLGVLNRQAHTTTTTEALIWTAVWVTLALAFNVGVYYLYEHRHFGLGLGIGHAQSGKEAAQLFLTGYVIEYSLSLDNIFVMAVIFSYFQVPSKYQHRVLFWGILGAQIMRGVMILAGTALIRRFDWIIYVFGALLIVTALKMLFSGGEKIHPDKNPLVRLARRFYPVTPGFEGQRFFARLDGRRAVTPLFLVLLVVESTDVVFAVDSIPAIFAITRDPFIVFTSNVFAILGLRSLYFVLAGMMGKFRYLKYSLVFVLAYVGVKMLLSHHYPIPTTLSLGIVCGALIAGIVASVIVARKTVAAGTTALVADLGEFAEQTWRQLRRVIILLVGCTVLLIGLALIVLPGPAFLVIPLGLAILGTEFLWARRLLRAVKNKTQQFARNFTGSRGPASDDH